MLVPRTPFDEQQRLEGLRRSGLLDTASEERFDRYTRLAKRLFGVPIALISLVDEDRQWFKSRQGLDAPETPRDISFCGHSILGDGIFVVPNALEDERFADNPLVTDDPDIRFYAGCPLRSPDGFKLGTLCIIDRQPRDLDREDLVALGDIGAMVSGEIAALRMATHDEMTGLSNRLGFSQLAQQALAVCKRHNRPACLGMIDLDGFKSINDTFGHEAGDTALAEFAGLLRETFRDSDVVARLGGDEFGVLLTGTTAESARVTTQRLADRVDELNARTDARYRLGFSAGLVEYSPSVHDGVDGLLRAADQAMYEVKHSRPEFSPA